MISIIIPVYNSEKYIKECLNSIFNNSIENLEIIIIDDGSSDNSKLYIDEFLIKYNNIKYFYQENKGVSKARNLGVLKSSGDYIMFLDSDDCLSSDFMDLVNEKIINEKPDCILYGHNKFFNDGKKIISKIDFLSENKIYNNYEILDNILNFKIKGYICDKIFKKYIWENNKIEFSNMKYCEDWFPITKAIYYSKKISVISKDIYCYRQHEDSAIHSRGIEVIKGYNRAVTNIIDFLEPKVKKENIDVFKSIAFCEIISEYTKIKTIKRIKKYKFFKKEDFINVKLFEVILNKNIKIKNKISIICWKFRIYVFLKELL